MFISIIICPSGFFRSPIGLTCLLRTKSIIVVLNETIVVEGFSFKSYATVTFRLPVHRSLFWMMCQHLLSPTVKPQLPKSHCTIFSVFSQTQMNSSARTVLTKTHSNDHPSVPPGRWIAASPVLTQTHWNDHPSIAPGRWAAALPVQSCSFTFSFQFAFWSIFMTCNWSERLTVSIKRQTCTSFNHDKTTACLAHLLFWMFGKHWHLNFKGRITQKVSWAK